jgi:hypothetical protein
MLHRAGAPSAERPAHAHTESSDGMLPLATAAPSPAALGARLE